MNYRLPAWLMLLFIFWNAGLVAAQNEGQKFRIDNSFADTVYYCREPVAVAPNIVLENIELKEPSEGIKVSIVNYRKGEDKLIYTGDKFFPKWNSELGNLELTGLGTAEELEMAVRQIFYENQASAPTTTPRSLSISLIDADYLPHTGHFYRYIPALDFSWKEARDSAALIKYYGLQGYLATITSGYENDFIWSKIDGVGWIGASDEEQEGIWKWVTGPEAGKVFWQGNAGGYAVNGSYSFWATGEPNNAGEEHYAHINQHPGKEQKSWNDLRNTGGGPQSTYYRAQGFVVEFGGMPGDPAVQLSAAAVIGWSQKPKMRLADFDSLVCGTLRQPLHLNFDQQVTTVLRPLQNNSRVIDQNSLSPVIEVDDFGNYDFEVEVINRDQCNWYENLAVKFRHQPTAQFQIDEAKCEGYNLRLYFEGDKVDDALFNWYSNDTLYFSGINADTLEIPLGFGSFNRSVGLKIYENGCADSLKLPVTVTPIMDFWPEKGEGCHPLTVQFNYSATEAIDKFFWEFGDGSTSQLERPGHLFNNPGTTEKNFDVSLRIVSAEGCENHATVENMVTVHPIPTIDFSFDESACYAESEAVWYSGSAGLRDTFLWDLTDFQTNEILEHPGFGAGPFKLQLPGRPTAEIGLQVVSEYGCKTDTLVQTLHRKPIFSIPMDTIGGCPPFDAKLALSTTDSIDEVSYSWDWGNGQLAEGSSVEQVFSKEDQILDVSVMAVSSFTGCADTLYLPGKIFVYPEPEASFVADPSSVLISHPVIHFNNSSQKATAFEWNFGDGAPLSDEEHTVHQFQQMGQFDVSLLAVNDFGCLDSAYTSVTVTFDKVFPPTAFSPNAELAEDREFRIYSEGIVNEGYNLLIFNRWGEVIFSSQSQEKGWNGTMKNGSNAPTGAYLWVVEYYDFLGKKHAQQGTVTLLY